MSDIFAVRGWKQDTFQFDKSTRIHGPAIDTDFRVARADHDGQINLVGTIGLEFNAIGNQRSMETQPPHCPGARRCGGERRPQGVELLPTRNIAWVPGQRRPGGREPKLKSSRDFRFNRHA